MTFYNFKYAVKIGAESLFSKTPKMEKLFPGFAQLEIKSKSFDSLESCEDEVKHLLVTLVQSEHKLTNKNYSLIKKTNPLFDAQAEEQPWDKSIQFRLYAAESDKLKDKILDYPFMGEVTLSGPDTVH